MFFIHPCTEPTYFTIHTIRNISVAKQVHEKIETVAFRLWRNAIDSAVHAAVLPATELKLPNRQTRSRET